MPRGRKGPPQESIDSILLAISRRGDIDADTMSHYFDRLDEEWTSGAREKVLHLLRSTDSSAHTAALLILSELATDFDLEELEDFVTDPTVSDMAKLSLATVLRDLGSDITDEGLVEYLNDPVGAVRQMQMRLFELVEQSEVGIETILEDVVSMPLERRLAFVNWLGLCKDPRAARLLVPLLESQPAKIIAGVLEALEHLGPAAIQDTIPALNHLIASTSNREVGQQARAVLGRLTMQSMVGAEDTAMYEAHQQALPPYQARVSYIDGSGLQLIMLSWQRPDGNLKVLNVLYQDAWGIKESYGVDDVDIAYWRKLAGDLEGEEVGSFELPHEYGCKLVVEARAMNRRTRRKVPIGYAVWRPLIDAGRPKEKKKKATRTVQVPELDAEMRSLAEHGAELYQKVEFASWLYDSVKQIEPYIMRYWAISQMQSEAIKSYSQRRKTKPQEAQREKLLEELVNEALQSLVDEQWRERYAQRLQRQATLFQYARREQDAALTSAVAAMVHPASQVPASEQPFLRAMLRISIEQGPLRLMMDVLSSGALEALPPDIAREF